MKTKQAKKKTKTRRILKKSVRCQILVEESVHKAAKRLKLNLSKEAQAGIALAIGRVKAQAAIRKKRKGSETS